MTGLRRLRVGCTAYVFWTKVFKRLLEYATFRFDNENVTNKLVFIIVIIYFTQ